MKINYNQFKAIKINENDWLKIFDLAGYTGDYFWFKPNN